MATHFAVAAHGVTAAPAAGPGETPVTFIVTSGSLSITVPASQDLGSGTPGATIGPTTFDSPVTVTDARAINPAAWTATVSASDLTLGGIASPPAGESIPVSAITYDSGAATATGTITVSAPLTPFTLSNTNQDVFIASAGIGGNTVSWTPTLTVTAPWATVSGTYSGTLTHSVS